MINAIRIVEQFANSKDKKLWNKMDQMVTQNFWATIELGGKLTNYWKTDRWQPLFLLTFGLITVLPGHGFLLPNRFGRGYLVVDGLLQHGVLRLFAVLLGSHPNPRSELHHLLWYHVTRSQVTRWNPLEGFTKSSCGKLNLVARSRLPTLERGRGSSWEPQD